MTTSEGPELKRLFEEAFGPILSRKMTLYIVLGSLGDFDSFEFVQSLLAKWTQFDSSRVDFYIIAIGDSKSKKYFCEYTKLPTQFLSVVETNNIHEQLGLNKGLSLPINPLFNLMLMCMGIHSEGTLAEVIRGYTGDRNANQIFEGKEKISFFNQINFNADLFNFLGDKGSLRPFELASRRLMNMTEIISNWNIYMNNNSFITQRSGTFLLDASQRLIYSYKSKALLAFSENMSNPMEFLYNRL